MSKDVAIRGDGTRHVENYLRLLLTNYKVFYLMLPLLFLTGEDYVCRRGSWDMEIEFSVIGRL